MRQYMSDKNMSDKTLSKYLEDIKDYTRRAISYTSNITDEEFCKDAKTIDATIRAIEIIGEAAAKIKRFQVQMNFSINIIMLNGSKYMR